MHILTAVYCSHCGAMASGNFCSACGHPLTPAVAAQAVDPVADQAAVPVVPAQPARGVAVVVTPGSWDHEVRYEVVVSVPMVRDMIAANASAAKTPMSGEKFLELADKAVKPLVPGLSLATVAAIAAPVYARMGLKTGQSRNMAYQRPSGRVLADVLCTLAANGYGVTRVQQGADGCVLECVLPSDWRSFAGELVVEVQRTGEGTEVRAATKIAGQLYDWGKSKQALDRVFGALQA